MLQSFLQIFGITDTRLRDPQTCFLHGIGDNLLPPTYVLTNSFSSFVLLRIWLYMIPYLRDSKTLWFSDLTFYTFKSTFYTLKNTFLALVLFCMVWMRSRISKYVLSLSYIRNHLYKKSLQSEFISPQVSGNISRVYWPSAQGFTSNSEHGELYTEVILHCKYFL